LNIYKVDKSLACVKEMKNTQFVICIVDRNFTLRFLSVGGNNWVFSFYYHIGTYYACGGGVGLITAISFTFPFSGARGGR